MQASLRAMACFVAVIAAAVRPAAAVTYNTYWGDLHGHTMESPVTLTQASIDAYILYARDTQGLNFVALSEKDFDLSDTEWSESRSRAAAFTTSSFVAFSAFEWGDAGYGDFGHRPVYYPTDDQPLFRSNAAATDHVSELLEAVAGTNGFTSVAHPDLSNYATDWDYFDATVDRVAEIYSRHGTYETGTRGLQQALAQGFRFGFIGVSDTRLGQPGSDGLTAVLSSSMSKSALHAAIKARRTYATTGARILLQATMDGHPVGEAYVSSTGPMLSVDCTPTAPLDRIEVLKNNVVVYTYLPLAATPPSATPSWRRGGEFESPGWTGDSFDDSSWKATTLDGTTATSKPSMGPVRLRGRVHFDAVPKGAILRINLKGDYKIWLNGKLLIDTHALRHDDPNRSHDCNGPSSVDLVGTPEWFHDLGFYNLAALGANLETGDNVIALEADAPDAAADPAVLELQPTTAAVPVSFTWADGNFTGDAFYYVRVTQTDGQKAWGSPWWVDRQAPDTTPPQDPMKLRAEKNGNDIYLDWPKVNIDAAGNFETIAYYRVFRGTTPDFIPDRVGLTNQIATTTHSYYRNTGALSAPGDYYYRVAAVDAAGNESTGESNLAYKMRHPLVFHSFTSNIYWLSVPYHAGYSTADQLARDLNRSTSGACTKVLRWDPALRRPVSWVHLGGQWMGSNFKLSTGEAVAIMIQQDIDAVLVGSHDPGEAVRLLGNPSSPMLNWVSIPLYSSYQLAFQIVQSMNSGYSPTFVTGITRLHPDTQTYQTYQWTGSTWSGTNFVVLPGEAYGVTVSTNHDWIPDTPE